MKKVLLIAAVAATLAGCGRSESAKAPSEMPRIETADDVVKAFGTANLKLNDVRVVNEVTDSNQLLGRPGQYTSKVLFYDARHPKSPDGGDEGENTVEVFNSPEDAKTRHDYIEGVTKGMPMLLQYQILDGKVLARFDKAMLPSEVEQYRKVLAEIAPD